MHEGLLNLFELSADPRAEKREPKDHPFISLSPRKCIFSTMENLSKDRSWHEGVAIGKKDYDLPCTGGYYTRTFYVIETSGNLEYPFKKVERREEHIRFL